MTTHLPSSCFIHPIINNKTIWVTDFSFNVYLIRIILCRLSLWNIYQFNFILSFENIHLYIASFLSFFLSSFLSFFLATISRHLVLVWVCSSTLIPGMSFVHFMKFPNFIAFSFFLSFFHSFFLRKLFWFTAF